MGAVMRTLAVAAFVLLASCSAPGAHALGRPGAPTPDRAAAEQVAMNADDAMRSSMADLDPRGLLAAFTGRALEALRSRLGWMRQRELRIQERNPSRSMVSWDAGSLEVVIEVLAERRLLAAGRPDPPWTRALRQWWSRLMFVEGAWRVADQKDLPPDQWRPPLTTWVLGAGAPY